MSDYLDPESFPFTESELRSAVAWLVPGLEQDELVQNVIDACVSVRAQNERARDARLRGGTDSEDVNDAVLVLSSEIYAALALTGESVAHRAEALMERWRTQSRKVHSQALMHERGHHPNAEPTQDVRSILDDEEAAALAAWNALKARVAAQRA